MYRYFYLRALLLLGIFIWIHNENVSAEEKKGRNPFILSLAGGYAGLTGAITETANPPFGFAQNGGFASLSGSYKIGKSWGIATEVSFQLNAYNAEKAALNVLEQDMLASAAWIEATSYQVYTVAVGPYYEVRILPAFNILITALGGMTIVHTPQITENVKTVPHTKAQYKSGQAGSLYIGSSIRPTWYIQSRVGIGLLIGGGYASPQIAADQSYSLQYFVFRTGLELSLCL